ncbi:Vacuolar fusion protein mon1 [Polyrhizophydium stewartii]|uniref:Vacuolar fusion protein MON1 n=1 Tax=Polyrhizophydium stewartii TaxID=2732419 RepID=A0ABR4N4I7_9FUNG
MDGRPAAAAAATPAAAAAASAASATSGPARAGEAEQARPASNEYPVEDAARLLGDCAVCSDSDDDGDVGSDGDGASPGADQDERHLAAASESATGLVAAREATRSALSLLEEDALPSNRGGYQRKHGNQGPNSPLWRAHKKHFFILSAAGKPIYTRYGDETKLSSFIGVIHALISFYAEDDDALRSMRAGGHLFVFVTKGPLYLVAVSCTGESEIQARDVPPAPLRRQLSILYDQITLTLTSTQLHRIFEQRVNYDLRNLLAGTEIFMDSLCKSFQRNAGLFLESTWCLRMPARMRDRISRTLVDAAPPKQLLFGLLFAGDKLVTFLRPRNYTIHPSDVSLLLNMILSSSAFRTVESWTPVCLPQFNNRGFLHAYVCFLSADVCLALLSAEKDAFFALSAYKRAVLDAFESADLVATLEDAMRAGPYSVLELGIPGLRSFLYRSKLLGQYTEPIPVSPYSHSQDRKRLLRLFQHAHEICQRRPVPSKFVCFATSHETVVTGSSETFAAFGPLVPKDTALAAMAELDRWIRRNEDTLFMTQSASLTMS